MSGVPLTDYERAEIKRLAAEGLGCVLIGKALGRHHTTVLPVMRDVEVEQPSLPPVLYRTDMAGNWWAGVSRGCEYCIGGWLLLSDDEVRCLQCARTAYAIQERQRPVVTFEPWEPGRRGRPPAAARVETCANGHPRDDDTLRVTPKGQRLCLACKREQAERMRTRIRVATHCRQGHPFDEENTYVDPQGARKCRACRRASGQRRRQA